MYKHQVGIMMVHQWYDHGRIMISGIYIYEYNSIPIWQWLSVGDDDSDGIKVA